MDDTARIETGHDSMRGFLENLREGKYRTPAFQRKPVWDGDAVKKLWSSVCQHHPFGCILMWETDAPQKKRINVSGQTPRNKAVPEFICVFDGQQRIAPLLTSVYGGRIAGRPGFEPSLYIDLTVELADDEDDGSHRSLFLFWDEIDDRGGKVKENTGTKKRFDQGLVIPLRDILERYGAVEERLNGAGCKRGDRPMVNLRRMRDVFSNYRICHMKIRGLAANEVREVCMRTSLRGVPLDMSDIVKARSFLSKGGTATTRVKE